MTDHQMDLFTWVPPGRVVTFPHSRRAALLREIADVFVRDGIDEGNRKMRLHGWSLVAEHISRGQPLELIGQALDEFTAAARAEAVRRLRALDPRDPSDPMKSIRRAA